MNRRWLCLASVGLLFVCVATLPAQADSSWKLPNLNPFASKSKETAPPKKSSGFKMPSLIPSWAKTERKQSSQPSTWSKISGSTKEFFGKTKDVLTPWDNPPKKNSYSNRKAEKKSFFTSWMKEEEPQRPRSVSEFLKQPRPTP